MDVTAPISIISRFLGASEARVSQTYFELDAAKRIAPIPTEDGTASYDSDGIATLALVAMLDPAEGRAVEFADALSKTTCQRILEVDKPMWPFPESQTKGASIIEVMSMLLAGDPMPAKALSVSTEDGTVRAMINAYPPGAVPYLAIFVGPKLSREPDGSAISTRLTAIDVARLPQLARDVGCIALPPVSHSEN